MAQSYPVECPSAQVHCVVVADDLTGACDAAVAFCRHGATARACLSLERRAEGRESLLAFSTDSRDLPAAEMRSRFQRLASYVRDVRSRTAINDLIFKKIDSTLRGNPGEEIAAALEAFGCEVAVIAPAFPEMGRRISGGYLHSDRDPGWQPVHVNTLLRAQGLGDCTHVLPGDIQAALAGECRFLSLDSVVNEDLDTIVRETLGCGRRVLWAGSAGLASGLARTLFPGAPNHSVPPERPNMPVLFAIGSDHPVMIGQLAELSRRYRLQYFDVDSADAETVIAALRSGRHTLLTIGRTASPDRLKVILNECGSALAALLLSGGDTASLVCRTIGAQAIRLEGEIVRGLPWGILEGGMYDKVPVATKSGAFGSPRALIEVADFFSCPAN